MGEKIPCEHCLDIEPAERCDLEVELTPEDAERYLPRDGQNNLIVPKACPNPPLTSIIRYGPDYYVLKKGRNLREGFTRRLPEYKG